VVPPTPVVGPHAAPAHERAQTSTPGQMGPVVGPDGKPMVGTDGMPLQHQPLTPTPLPAGAKSNGFGHLPAP